ncbi:MAG: D-2-hydroxyacid dehydrogenase [Chloroflexota bacterium]
MPPESSRPVLLIATPMTAEQVRRLAQLYPGVEIRTSDWPPPAAALAGADAAVLWQVRTEWLDGAPRLRWVHTGGAGVESQPLADLAARGIALTNNSGVHVPNMPEHVLAMMLAFARRLPTLIRRQQLREWRDEATHREVFDLEGQTVLLAGMGEIGLGTGERAAALGMLVEGVRRRESLPAPGFVRRTWAVRELAAALAGADHVVNSLPLTPETRGMFGQEAFAAMRPGAYFYNVGRGGTVDQEALTAALRSGRLAGAGLDVTDPEPLPAESPLWEMEQVIITSHTSGASPRYWERATELIGENIGRWLAGEPLRNAVDLDAGY